MKLFKLTVHENSHLHILSFFFMKKPPKKNNNNNKKKKTLTDLLYIDWTYYATSRKVPRPSHFAIWKIKWIDFLLNLCVLINILNDS